MTATAIENTMSRTRQGTQLVAFKTILLILCLHVSSSICAKTFFEPSTEKPSGYYNNDGIRQESIDNSKQRPIRHFSDQHKLVIDYLNSNKDSVATHAEWETKTLLRVGVVRRSLKKIDYSNYTCELITAAGINNKNITVRIIYLPSLIASQQLDILSEKKCLEMGKQ